MIDPVTGQADYDPKKGEFVWAFDVRPVLRFHNGKWHKAMIATNDVLAGEPVDLGSPAADRSDPDAMIYPFKKMIGNQIADAANRSDLRYWSLTCSGFSGGPQPYWVDYEWDPALWDADDLPLPEPTYSG